MAAGCTSRQDEVTYSDTLSLSLHVSLCLAMAAALGQFLDKVPSAMFEASVPGVKTYTPVSRAACWLIKFAEYSLAGIFCGVVGQGIANGMMQLK